MDQTSNRPTKPKRRRGLSNRAARWIIAIGLLYGVLAYLAAPAFWSFRDRDKVVLPQSMVTTTVDGIRGGPINVGLVGSKAEVIHAFTVAGWHPADAITLRSSIEIGE